MSGIMLAFFVSGGAAAPLVADGSFSGAPIADVAFGG